MSLEKGKRMVLKCFIANIFHFDEYIPDLDPNVCPFAVMVVVLQVHQATLGEHLLRLTQTNEVRIDHEFP